MSRQTDFVFQWRMCYFLLYLFSLIQLFWKLMIIKLNAFLQSFFILHLVTGLMSKSCLTSSTVALLLFGKNYGFQLWTIDQNRRPCATEGFYCRFSFQQQIFKISSPIWCCPWLTPGFLFMSQKDKIKKSEVYCPINVYKAQSHSA